MRRGRYLTFGRGRRPIDFWLSKLNGKIEFIRGAHDTERSLIVPMREYQILLVEPHKFYLVHDYNHIPDTWTDWAIHGHCHNLFPFIDRERKRINVSVEVIDYTPVSIEYILEKVGLNGTGSL